ncbi:HTH-type transcriptional regulator AcrR [Nonomuraea coxensis DSM 45129]|uniref:HTH-type transcriptional regulator AcrR n=1 Tax=Nonomuraea coxensis DSM 45129 TaxID=1122611 RepID=A0ABX8U124_9ACTN|nr:TetR/AcrR family transcriptional regulator [Nonomuraea coxensis]QYC40621.1 HTH-type transcriptional regulator AcrR [Nonomuraea coxensis DSM 45129]
MAGLRERKKQRTRRALIDAALRLFARKGYADTTLAEIAAAAEVSTRTFFSYFGGKDDLVFHDSEERAERALALLAGRRPGESAGALLLRLVEAGIAWALEDDELTFEEAELRLRLVMEEPALRARALLLMYDNQLKVAAALRQACPEELDEVEAAAAVGALFGAIKLAVMAHLGHDRSLKDIQTTGRRAAELALDGLRALETRRAEDRPAGSRIPADPPGMAS